MVQTLTKPDGSFDTMLFDLSQNKYYGLPIYINTSHLIEVKEIKKDSDLYNLYLQVTSGIIISKEKLS